MKTKKWFYPILAFWLLFVLAFGLWWLYLLRKLAIQALELTQQDAEYIRLARMLEMEGTTFIIILIAGGVFAAWVYWQDIKKSRSIQAFFSSLTHELKTPLASMRLQAEVIDDTIQSGVNKDKLPVLLSRLLEDSKSLETQMDKALQLARVEQGGVFHKKPISLMSFFERKFSKEAPTLNFPKELQVLGDDFALELIFKNFFENTKRHQGEKAHITIETRTCSQKTYIEYNDHGSPFTGDIKKLGTLFYKHNSSQGTGVGLYLSKKLAYAMGGKLEIKKDPHLIFTLQLNKVSHT